MYKLHFRGFSVPAAMATCALFALLVLVPAAWAQAGTAASKRLPDVPYVPTSAAVVNAMLELAGVQSTDVVYDLGCGDGRIVIAAAKDFGARGVGIEINPARIQEANQNAERAGIAGRVRFEENDFFRADISEATVVTLYLLTSVNEQLKPKLLNELKPGTRIVSNTFEIEGWEADREVTVDGRRIMLWTVPAR